MVKHILLAATLSLLAAMAIAADRNADVIAGVWQTKTGGYVQIYRDHGHWVGRIVGSKSGTARYDTHNPDPSKRGRRLLGVVILHGLSYQGDGEYRQGSIYDPNNGKDYHAKASLRSRDVLDVRGYIGFSLIGKTQTWHRIEPQTAHVHPDLLHRPIPAGPKPSN